MIVYPAGKYNLAAGRIGRLAGGQTHAGGVAEN
jgi:hypothetical protein